MPICTSCNQDKGIECFSPDRTKKKGVKGTCKECSNAKAKQWRENNKLRATITRLYWRLENRDRHLYKKAQYRALRAKAQPPWLSEEQMREIREIYSQAAILTFRTGIEHQVDHIHPIKGDGYCGLHVPWNLQVLSYKENALKSNKFPKDEEHLLWDTQFRTHTTDFNEQTESSSTSKQPASIGELTRFVDTSSRSVLWQKIRCICRCDTKADLIYQRIKSEKC